MLIPKISLKLYGRFLDQKRGKAQHRGTLGKMGAEVCENPWEKKDLFQGSPLLPLGRSSIGNSVVNIRRNLQGGKTG